MGVVEQTGWAPRVGQLAEIKRILTAMEAALGETVPGSVIITSALPSEGKTTLTAGLAYLSALQGRYRTLAVDLNWYRPALHGAFGVEPGEAEAKMEQETLPMKLLRPSGIPNLDLLVAPASWDPAEGSSELWSLRAVEWLRQARENYERILVDTSPLFPVNRYMMDPAVFGRAADRTILVLLAYVTPRSQVKRGLKILESSGAKMAGLVINQWKNPLFKETPKTADTGKGGR